MNERLLAIWIFINIVAYFVTIATLDTGSNFSFVNPLVIYKNIKVNWAGCIILTIIFNIVFLAVSIPYWIYKLFTVGRKED